MAHFIPATGELTLWNTTQNPHIVRFIMSLVTGVPEDRLRVVAPEVGGGFGSKIPQIQGDFIAALKIAAQVDVGSTIARLGQRLVEGVARTTMDRFYACLAKRVT